MKSLLGRSHQWARVYGSELLTWQWTGELLPGSLLVFICSTLCRLKFMFKHKDASVSFGLASITSILIKIRGCGYVPSLPSRCWLLVSWSVAQHAWMILSPHSSKSITVHLSSFQTCLRENSDIQPTDLGCTSIQQSLRPKRGEICSFPYSTLYGTRRSSHHI